MFDTTPWKRFRVGPVQLSVDEATSVGNYKTTGLLSAKRKSSPALIRVASISSWQIRAGRSAGGA
jgi:hypothetical protein